MPSFNNNIHNGATTTYNTTTTSLILEKVIRTVFTSGLAFSFVRFLALAVKRHYYEKDPEAAGRIEKFWFSILKLAEKNFLNKYIDSTCIWNAAQSEESFEANEKSKNDVMSSSAENLLEDKADLLSYGGSCHCQAVKFTLLAKPKLTAYDSPGKIRYAYIPTATSNFQITKGTNESLSFYYMLQQSTMAAYVFCKKCGVHILRAPDKMSDFIDVNFYCLDLSPHACSTSNISHQILSTKSGFSHGVPFSSQELDKVLERKIQFKSDAPDIITSSTISVSSSNLHSSPIYSPQLSSLSVSSCSNYYNAKGPLTLQTQDDGASYSSIESNSKSISSSFNENHNTSQLPYGLALRNASVISKQDVTLPPRHNGTINTSTAKSPTSFSSSSYYNPQQMKHFMNKHLKRNKKH